MLGTKQKAPADVLDYDVDYTNWIATGDSITTAVATADKPEEIEVESVQVSSEAIVKVWLSGGTAGETYEITVTASTDAGRVKEESFKIRVKEA